jgi:hypothetical protein
MPPEIDVAEDRMKGESQLSRSNAVYSSGKAMPNAIAKLTAIACAAKLARLMSDSSHRHKIG